MPGKGGFPPRPPCHAKKRFAGGFWSFSAGVGKFYARPVLRRLFSTFAHGWPGAGLLLMRLVVGITLVVRRIIELQSAPPISLAVIHVLGIAAGILLFAG